MPVLISFTCFSVSEASLCSTFFKKLPFSSLIIWPYPAGFSNTVETIETLLFSFSWNNSNSCKLSFVIRGVSPYNINIFLSSSIKSIACITACPVPSCCCCNVNVTSLLPIAFFTSSALCPTTTHNASVLQSFAAFMT